MATEERRKLTRRILEQSVISIADRNAARGIRACKLDPVLIAAVWRASGMGRITHSGHVTCAREIVGNIFVNGRQVGTSETKIRSAQAIVRT